MIRLLVDDATGYVLGYATVGGDDSWMLFSGEVPDEFYEWSWKYKLADGVLVRLSITEQVLLLNSDRFLCPRHEIAEFVGITIDEVNTILGPDSSLPADDGQ